MFHSPGIEKKVFSGQTQEADGDDDACSKPRARGTKKGREESQGSHSHECERSPKVSQPPRKMLRAIVRFCVCTCAVLAYITLHTSLIARIRVYSGVVCHSQALAKYAKPFVSDLLSWHERHSRAGSPQTELNVSASCPRALPAPFFISHSAGPHPPIPPPRQRTGGSAKILVASSDQAVTQQRHGG